MTTSTPLTRNNWRWAILWSLTIIFLSYLPYFIIRFISPDGWQFTGVLANPFDNQSYLAKMRHGYDGHWLFHVTYTAEPHQGVVIYTFYLALGHLAAFSGLPLTAIFHAARLIAGFCLHLVIFRFIALVTPDQDERRLAFLLILTGSGLGWLGLILGAFPIDLWVPEAFVPYSLYTNPHFLVGMVLMVIIFQAVLQPALINEPPTSTLPPARLLPSLLGLGLTAVALGFILIFGLATVWAMLGIYLGWRYLTGRRLPWSQIWPTLAVILFSGPIVLYYYWVSLNNPVVAGWSVQNVTPAPKIIDLILGYGLTGLLAGLGVWFILRNRSTHKRGEWFVFWWALTTIILVYLPFDLQRRFITGLHIPLAILAAIGLQRWLRQRQIKRRRRRQISIGVITLGLLGTLFVWSLPLLSAQQSATGLSDTDLLFLQAEEIAGLTWLDANSQADDVILASPRLGLFIPVHTGARTFYGHPFETVEAEEKKALVQSFYKGEVNDVPPAVDFIIYGPSERAIGRPKILSTYPVVFSTDEIKIYKVTR